MTIKDVSGKRLRSKRQYGQLYSYSVGEPPPPELRFVSTPRDTDVMETTDYYYNPSAGEGISVYIVDTGVYTGNSEFTNLPGGYRWIWPTQDFWRDSSDVPYEEVDSSEHGTCLMSKVVGKRFGVAKKASTVIAKWIYGAPISWQVLVLEIITRVRKDILTKGLQGKAVINMSFGQQSDDQEHIAALEAVLTDLVRKLDVVVVISAGYIEVSHELTIGSEHQLGMNLCTEYAIITGRRRLVRY